MEEKKFEIVSASNFNDNTSKKSHINFTKSILLPFFSGIVGSTLIIGICFGSPTIKNKLFNTSNSGVQVPTSSFSGGNNNGTVEQISLSNYSDTAIYASNKILPSIVGIEIEFNVTSSLSLFGGAGATSTATASGSGIIISKDGYIVTNNHVVDSSSTSSYSYYNVSEAKSIKVKLYNDDTVYNATIIGKDSKTDLAVIKIDAQDLTPAEFANSDNVKIGEFVMAVGNPLGLENSITDGIVSAVNRQVSSNDGNAFTCIQTNAAINSGNSGGALVNSEGKVIGINTLKLSGTGVEGIGFAIPINSTLNVINDLMEHKKVLRPYIGISAQDLDEETAKRNNTVVGVYIKAIEEFSAAEKAGLKVGDVIIRANGTTVKTFDDLEAVKNSLKIGDELKLTVYRNRAEKEITVILQEAP
ncbi:MAG: trypsin-like serine protease [Clostridia bacterium]|nr:trypsin-like serine protease [Clostridia bacterium]